MESKTDEIPDRYEVLEILGTGGMGTVYKARDLLLDKLIAIKVLRPNLVGEDSKLIQRFQREAQAAGRLHHDNLVTILDFGFSGQTPYLVMDYVKGDTLKKHIIKEGRLSLELTLDVGIQIACAIIHAHKHGVVHRDLKSANVVIAQETGVAKVIDFGIARLLDNDSAIKLTGTNAIVGSPLFISPEQTRGSRGDEKSDIYSLGCIIYECYTGTPPFKGDTALETIEMHISAPIPNCNHIELQHFFQMALAKDPQNRFESMDELLLHLKSIQEQESEPDNYTKSDTINDGISKSDTQSYNSVIVAIILLTLCCFLFLTLSVNKLNTANKKSTNKQLFPRSAGQIAGRQKIKFKGNSLIVYGNVSHSEIKKALARKSIEKIELKDVVISELLLDSVVDSNARHFVFRTSNFENQKMLSKLKQSKVEFIDVSETNISDFGLSLVADCKKLEVIEAGHNSVGDAALNQIGQMKKLRSLELNDTNISNNGLEALSVAPKLEKLRIDQNSRISDKGLVALAKISTLKKLNLSNLTGVTDIGIQSLKTKLPKCKIIH